MSPPGRERGREGGEEVYSKMMQERGRNVENEGKINNNYAFWDHFQFLMLKILSYPLLWHNVYAFCTDLYLLHDTF